MKTTLRNVGRMSTTRGMLAGMACFAAAGVSAMQLKADARQPADPGFAWVDVMVDAGDLPLAAYQVELNVEGDAQFTVVGVEGGEAPSFREPPAFDERTREREVSRLVLAAFSLDEARALPRGRTRVASVMYEASDRAAVRFTVRLEAAADPDGAAIDAAVSVERGQADRN